MNRGGGGGGACWYLHNIKRIAQMFSLNSIKNVVLYYPSILYRNIFSVKNVFFKTLFVLF